MRRDLVRSSSGRALGSEPVPEGEPPADLDALASLRSAAARSLAGEPALPVRRDELRRRLRARARKALIVFAIDASESMESHERISIAKGAAIALLRHAYLRRDRVAVVVFEGSSARVLLPPTASIDLARERLRRLPLGGTTPLAAGLLEAWRVIGAHRLREPQLLPRLILLSDGRANVPLDPKADPRVEALALADRIREDGIDSLVVDAGSSGPTRPELIELAFHLGASCLRVGHGGIASLIARINASPAREIRLPT
jgi:magnesium chelatase subunit D